MFVHLLRWQISKRIVEKLHDVLEVVPGYVAVVVDHILHLQCRDVDVVLVFHKVEIGILVVVDAVVDVVFVLHNRFEVDDIHVLLFQHNQHHYADCVRYMDVVPLDA